MTENEIRSLVSATAEVTARKAAHEVLIALGVDVTRPFEMQRDFQHLRSWRESSEAVKRYGILTLIGLFLTGIAGAVIAAFRAG